MDNDSNTGNELRIFDIMQKEIQEQFDVWMSYKGIACNESININNILTRILLDSDDHSPYQSKPYSKIVHYNRFSKYCKSNK